MNFKALFFPLTVGILLIMFFLMIRPGWNDLNTKKVELTKVKDAFLELEEGVDSVESSLNDYELMDDDMKTLIMNALPEEKNSDDLLSEIYSNAKKAGINLFH